MSHELRAQHLTGTSHMIGRGKDATFAWEKRATAPARGILLCVHGSSTSSLPQFDLQVPDRPDASLMNWFASAGFDVWCFDCRGYGRSYKGEEVWATCAEGAADIARVAEYIRDRRACEKLAVYGSSSGALRACLFAADRPELTGALLFDGFVWTGANSPTLEQRRKKLDESRAASRRKLDRAFIATLSSRDGVDSADPVLVEHFCEQLLAENDSVPTGTYIDMCQNLPLVAPEDIAVPTLIVRGQHDGIATLDDVSQFFERLPNAYKRLDVLEGIAHATSLQKHVGAVYRSMYSFLSEPELGLAPRKTEVPANDR